MSQNIINDDIFSQSNPAYTINIFPVDDDGGHDSTGGVGNYGNSPVGGSGSETVDPVDVGVSYESTRNNESFIAGLPDVKKNNFALLGYGVIAYLILS